MWAGHTDELFYLTPNDTITAVDVSDLDATGDVGEAAPLFSMALHDGFWEVGWSFDVTPDGQRFLMNALEPPEPLTLIQNWGALLTRDQ